MKTIIILAFVFFFTSFQVNAQDGGFFKTIEDITRKVERVTETLDKAIYTYERTQRQIGSVTGGTGVVTITLPNENRDIWTVVKVTPSSTRGVQKSQTLYYKPGDDGKVEVRVHPNHPTKVSLKFKFYLSEDDAKHENDTKCFKQENKETYVDWDNRVNNVDMSWVTYQQ